MVEYSKVVFYLASTISKYLAIYHKLIRQIEKSVYPVGSKIPSESSLMEEYNASRDTIRKSLNMLEQNGYINKVKGKGSFVLGTSKIDFPVSELVSFRELSNRVGSSAETVVEEFQEESPVDFIKRQLELNDSTNVWKVTRARKIDGERVILDKEYYRSDLVPGLTKEICEGSIFEYIEGTLSHKIGFARKEFVAVFCNDEDKAYLDLKEYNMVVVVHTYVYLENGTLLQYGQSRHRPDKFKFVDFARRIHRN